MIATTAIVAGSAGLIGGFYEGRALGQNEGQTQATKNLVTAVETIGTEFRKEFNYYSNHAMLTNDAARCRLLGHGYLEAFERSFLESASEIAKGKIKIEDASHFKCLKKDYDGKIGDIAQF